MKSVSPILRLICGIAILFLTWTSWSKNKAAIAAGEPVQFFGKTMEADSATITLAYGIIAVMALGLILLGVFGLTRNGK